MEKIVDNLKDLLEENIILEKIVKLIDWNNGSEKIQLLCNDGTIYATNNLVCTMPIGTLKRNHLAMFSPRLPKNYINIIDNIGWGTINKIFLHFDTNWWANDWKGLQLIWNENLNDVSFI